MGKTKRRFNFRYLFELLQLLGKAGKASISLLASLAVSMTFLFLNHADALMMF
jgi:hypothetical protein